MSSEPKLTKKQRKGLAHRERGRKKSTQLSVDVPEAELLVDEDQGHSINLSPIPSENKKRKRESLSIAEEEGTEESKDTLTKKKKLIPPKSMPKSRFIVFVGNLSYKTSAEAIQSHFTSPSIQSPSLSKPPLVRLLTKKVPQGTLPKSRTKGCAFVEFSSGHDLQKALKLHHTELEGRVINVELTAGGGGSGEKRKQKVVERNTKLETQRNKNPSTNSGPPQNYGEQHHTSTRHSTTSGSLSTAPDSKKTWSEAENGAKPKQKIRGVKKKPISNGVRWASGANAVQSTRVWGSNAPS